MKHKKQLLAITLHKKRLLSAVIGSICAAMASQPVQAAVWTGAGADANIDTLANWQNNLAPVTSTDATLVFDTLNVGTGSFTVNNNLTQAPVYNVLQFNNGGFNLTGSQIALRPSSNNYDTTIITNKAGNNTITAPLRIDPNTVDFVLSQQTLSNAQISVQNGSLTLGGSVSASQVNIYTSLGSPASLSMQYVNANSFSANGGIHNLTGVLDSKTVVLGIFGSYNATNFNVSGANGLINTAGGQIAVGHGSQLTLDNTAFASNNRLDGSADVIVDRGTLLLKGNATTDISQNSGRLFVGDSTNYSGLTNISILGAGANTSLTFSSLSSNGGLVNFSSTGTLGDKEHIKFTSAPTLTDGMMLESLVNGREFATYDATKGVIAATDTTTLPGVSATNNVYINAAENLSGNASINSLAVNNAAITASGASAINLASGKLLTSGAVNIAPSINFGAKAGEIINLGNTVLAGGVTGSNGLNVLGNGSLELAGAGSVNGAFNYTGQLVLSADNALQGADLNARGKQLDIGATTQHLNSFYGGTSTYWNNDLALPVTEGSVVGSGRIVAANDINLRQNLVNVSLEGKNVSVLTYDPFQLDYDNGTVIINGNIQASQNVILNKDTDNYGTTLSNNVVMNGVISGAAQVNMQSSKHTTFTNQNTYTGATTGNLILSGNGSIAASSGFSGGNLTMRAAVGDNGALDRIGNTAAVSLRQGTRLTMEGSGNIAMSENFGALNVTGAAYVALSNGVGGSTSLRADSLNLASGSVLNLALGDASGFYLNAGPSLYTGTNMVKDVYVQKSIGTSYLPSWAAYDASNGRISEALVAEKTLNSAGSNEFVRVTDATNQTLNSSHTVGAVNIDTNQSINGSGTLTVGTGQMLFWKDNTINLAGLNFGAQQGVVTNAGSNTIASVISGNNGMVKKGWGYLELTGNNTYTGPTEVAEGGLSVASGGHIGDVKVDYNATLNLTGTAKITSNYGTVNLNTAYTNQLGNIINSNLTTINSIHVNAGLTNLGSIQGYVYNDSSSVSNSGNIDRLENVGTLSNLTNSAIGTVNTLGNDGTVVNNGTVNYLANNGTVVNNGTVNGLSTYGTFTNNGTLVLDNGALGGTVINTATAILNNSSVADGFIKQTAGTTTINGDLRGNVQLEGGILKGAGRIFGDVVATNGAIVAPGNSPGTLTIDGSLHLLSGSSLELQVYQDSFGNTIFDKLIIGGTYAFDSGSSIKFDFGTSGFSGDNFIALNGNAPQFVFSDFFKKKDGSSFDFSSLDNVAIAGLATTSGVVLNHVTSAGTAVSSVPVPAAVWMFGSGLLGLTGFARKRKAA